jgi:hypothetical protein
MQRARSATVAGSTLFIETEPYLLRGVDHGHAGGKGEK